MTQELDSLTIVIELPGGDRVEVNFDPIEDADFIQFFNLLTPEEQEKYIRSALTLAALKDKARERE